jgi:hypothetical protein
MIEIKGKTIDIRSYALGHRAPVDHLTYVKP